MSTGTALVACTEAGLPHLPTWWWGLCTGGWCSCVLTCDMYQQREHTGGCCIVWGLRLEPSFRNENNLLTQYTLFPGSNIILHSPCSRSSFIFPRHYFPFASYGLVCWSIYSVEMELNSPGRQNFLFCMGEAQYQCDWNLPLWSDLKGRDDSCVKLFELIFVNSWQ